MRLIITRPQDRALPLAEKLKGLGHEVMLAPVLKIARAKFEVPSEPLQGILFTSVQGVEAVAGLESIKMFPVYAVGSKTAAAARAVGFETVHNAEGGVEALLDLVLQKCNSGKGLLLHLSGAQTTGNLVERLREKGFSARRITVYEALAADDLPTSVIEKMRAGAFDAVLFFSPRTANIFRTLVEEIELDDTLDRAFALCLSENIAVEARKLPWRKVHVTEAPSEQSMIDLLQSIRK